MENGIFLLYCTPPNDNPNKHLSKICMKLIFLVMKRKISQEVKYDRFTCKDYDVCIVKTVSF